MSAMLTLGYPRGKWAVAANRRPVHEVSSRNHWDRPFGVEVPEPLCPRHDDVIPGSQRPQVAEVRLDREVTAVRGEVRPVDPDEA